MDTRSSCIKNNEYREFERLFSIFIRECNKIIGIIFRNVFNEVLLKNKQIERSNDLFNRG